MVSFPPCKINLGLRIVSKRADGYHDLDTCFYSIPWTDILEIIPAQRTTFSVSGNPIPGNEHDNLCMKAYHLLKKDFDLPEVAVHLHKVIPTGAGLGGGSSDCAHTLRLLDTMFSLKLSQDKLMSYAATLGSDCAFFVQDKAMIGTGRGEILHPVNVDLAGKYLVLVKPPVHVSTSEAYAGVTPHVPSENVQTIVETVPLRDWKGVLKNDFEASVFRHYPAIAEIKSYFYQLGAAYASMSGSGSAVFGIFNHVTKVTVPSDHTVWSGYLQ
jgi:4-diphosphocytidyl-2-C-methyl-D-erythritol kinase